MNRPTAFDFLGEAGKGLLAVGRLDKDTAGHLRTITLKEGKNRRIRKTVEAIGNQVVSLKRISVGSVSTKKVLAPVGGGNLQIEK